MNRYFESERGKFARYDSTLGWTGKENVQDDFLWMDVSHRVRQNRYGCRGGEYPFGRTGKPRLLVLGDSYAWGFGVEEQQLFTSLLERNRNRDVEVVNLGVSGYGTDQEYLLWKNKGHQWKPDQVLLLVTLWTDLWDNTISRQYGYEKPVFEPNASGELVLKNTPVPREERHWSHGDRSNTERRSAWFSDGIGHSAVAAALVNFCVKSSTIRKLLEEHGIIPIRQGGYGWEVQMYAPEGSDEMDKPWQVTFALIAKLAAEVKGQGGRLVVAVAPSPVQVYPELWRERLGGRELGNKAVDPSTPNKRLEAWCRQRGIQFIDLLTPLQKAGRTTPYLYFPLNLHWTANGHQVVAEVLAQELSLFHP